MPRFAVTDVIGRLPFVPNIFVGYLVQVTKISRG